MSSAEKIKNKKVYIAGPMTGLPNYNFAAFDRAAEILKARGLEPMNPADIGRRWLIDNAHREPDADEYQELLDAGREQLRKCGRIYLLRGWEKSKGAKSELYCALVLGLQIELEEAE